MRIIHLAQTDSTNDVLKRWLKEGTAPDGSKTDPEPWTAVCADSQSGGRGRRGRSFYSPRGGLYFTVLLPAGILPPERLTPLCACAVCGALETLGVLGARVKWVNDIYLRDRKVAGILCEGLEKGILCGIGVNMTSPEGGFPPEAGPAGALDCEGLGKEELLLAVLEAMRKLIEDGSGLLDRYRALQWLTGKRVECRVGGETFRGVAEGVADDFSLIVRTETGVRFVSSGEVTRTRIAEEV